MFSGKLIVCAVSVFATAATGCERDPLECTPIAAGALVVTEVSNSSELGEWLELYNSSSAGLDLLGVRVEFLTLDGGSTQEFTVRRSLVVAADSYVTLGRFADGSTPPEINYGYADDLDDSLLARAAVKVIACGDEVDQIIYRELPEIGTLALDGGTTPDAEGNNVEESFCTDLVGSPGEENPSCT